MGCNSPPFLSGSGDLNDLRAGLVSKNKLYNECSDIILDLVTYKQSAPESIYHTQYPMATSYGPARLRTGSRNPSSHRIRQRQIHHVCDLFGTIGVRCQRLRHQSIQEFQHRLISRVVLGPVQVRAFSDVWIEVRDETDEIRSHIQTAKDIEQVGRMELALQKNGSTNARENS